MPLVRSPQFASEAVIRALVDYIRSKSYRVRTGFTGEARSPAWDAMSVPHYTL
jgi:hypothetical protein